VAKTDALKLIPFLEKGAAAEGTIYHAIGVEPIINCRGTFTIIGGSIERPECLRAMEAATGFFAQYDELAHAVGERLAAITGAEWGLITSGCAAAMRHVTTACVTGGNPEKLIRIPDLSGFEKTEVIAPRTSRNAYDHAVRNVGVDMVEVDTAEELERAIGPKTAMIYIVTGGRTDPGQPLSLETIAKIARPHGIPILADAAAEVLTIPNVHLEQGATVVTYSGGKAICGPQAAGIALGDKALLRSAWQASAPHHGPGRDDKVGKEEILGMLAAVEAWITRDHEAEWQQWLGMLDTIAQSAAGIDSVTTSIQEPTGLGNRAPSLTISWDPAVLHITGHEVAEDFGRKAPRIAVGDADDAEGAHIRINPSQMGPGQVEVVAERVRAILTAERPPKPAQMAAPTVNLAGGWEPTGSRAATRATSACRTCAAPSRATASPCAATRASRGTTCPSCSRAWSRATPSRATSTWASTRWRPTRRSGGRRGRGSGW
jgi:seryl-tRNA(Sec) selenium transferase